MAFKLPQFGSGKASTAAKKPAARTAAKPATVKKSGTVSTGTRKGGVGYRQAHISNSASSRWMALPPRAARLTLIPPRLQEVPG